MKKYIYINNISVKDKHTIFCRVRYPKRLKKYFSSDYFYAKYDKEIDEVDKSILYIPPVSALVNFAWAVGADIYVKELDQTYLKSIENIKSTTEKWFPNFSFSTKINVEKLTLNKFSNNGYALLFSGGLDSIVSYIRNKNKKPTLISIWGLDIPIKKEDVWKQVQIKLARFAEEENIKIHFVKTNAREMLNSHLLSVEFGLSWWERVSHGIVTASLCAPLTKDEISTVLIASSQQIGKIEFPWGSYSSLDNKISWADVKVFNDSAEFNRQEKIRHILRKYISNGHPLSLRVCTRTNSLTNHDLNCGECEKCLRTIIGLVLEGIDPNKCGFKVTSDIWEYIKQSFANKKIRLIKHPRVHPDIHVNRVSEWEIIKQSIPEIMDHNLLNSRQFFEWLRNFDLEKYGLEIEKNEDWARIWKIVKIRLFSCLAVYYYMLPNIIQNWLKKTVDSLFI